MSKTIRNMYDKKLTFNNIVKAYERARKSKTSKGSTLRFEKDLESNLVKIYDSLNDGTYKPGPYHTFTVYEPKERVIKSLQFMDRVVQQWYIGEFIKPYIVNRFIYDTYACIEEKGTHKAVYRVQYYMRCMRRNNQDYYVLKGDIHKFFYNINKDVLYDIMCKYIDDKKLLSLTKIFIYDDNNAVGIPIGNYTSQFFANIYLNELDHYVKETLKIKYYVRYMDDFIILLDNKEECKSVLENITNYVETRLRLTMNSKSRYYPNKMGIDFCGYRIFNTHLLLRTRSIKKIKRNIRMWYKMESGWLLDEKGMLRTYIAWQAHAKHANSYWFMVKINNEIVNLQRKIY